ncbi:MAG: four helix bundle protein [Calditrichia bacterium]
MTEVKNFTDLRVWQKALSFKLSVYRLTEKFPDSEKFVLTSQIRRAVISITANIAEGYGRFSYKDHIHFLIQARGSLYETYDHLIAAYKLKYITKSDFVILKRNFYDLIKVLNGYIKFIRSKIIN